MFFNLCILIFYNAYPWRYFFYFEFRQKVHIVYFCPHLLFGAQIFHKNWNIVPYSYYNGKILTSDRWRSYKTWKLKKCVFSIFFKFNLVVHLNKHVHRIVGRDVSFHVFVISGVTDLISTDTSLNEILYRVFQACNQPSDACNFSIFNCSAKSRTFSCKIVPLIGMFSDLCISNHL